MLLRTDVLDRMDGGQTGDPANDLEILLQQ